MKRCPICGCEPRRRLAVSEVALALDISDRQVRRYLECGLLLGEQLNPPRGRWVVFHDSLDAFKLRARHAGQTIEDAELATA